MFNTKLVLLLITLFFVITSFISQTTTTESDARFVNDTDQDHLDFTDFKERGLPLVEKKAERRIRPTNWFRFCYVFILPIIVTALCICLMVSFLKNRLNPEYQHEGSDGGSGDILGVSLVL